MSTPESTSRQLALAQSLRHVSDQLRKSGRLVFLLLFQSVALLAVGLAVGADYGSLNQRIISRALVGAALGCAMVGLAAVWRFDERRKLGESIRLELNYGYQQSARESYLNRMGQSEGAVFEELPEVQEAFRIYSLSADLPFVSGGSGVAAYVVGFIALSIIAGALFPSI